MQAFSCLSSPPGTVLSFRHALTHLYFLQVAAYYKAHILSNLPRITETVKGRSSLQPRQFRVPVFNEVMLPLPKSQALSLTASLKCLWGGRGASPWGTDGCTFQNSESYFCAISVLPVSVPSDVNSLVNKQRQWGWTIWLPIQPLSQQKNCQSVSCISTSSTSLLE